MRLLNHNALIGLHTHQRLHHTTGPMNLQRIYLRVVPKPSIKRTSLEPI